MLELAKIDLEQIAAALEDQTDYDRCWLIDPRAGEIVLWTSDTGIEGENPVDLDELDLLPIGPVSSRVWYRGMVDFAEGISNATAARRLARHRRQGRVPPVQARALRASPGTAVGLASLPRRTATAPVDRVAARRRPARR